jgi:hypothetical protein
MGVFDWLTGSKKRKDATKDDGSTVTSTVAVQRGGTAKVTMMGELAVDPHFVVHKKFAEIFSRLPDSDTRGQACKDFLKQLQQNRMEALMSVLSWSGNCSGMDCKNFIFAIYDEWFEPLTPKVIWKIHIATDCLDLSPEDSSFALTPLAQFVGETINKGDKEYVSQLETSAPTGAQEHFAHVVRKVRELFT